MKTLFGVRVWCVLLMLWWAIALLALVLWPVGWLLSLPFRLVGITVSPLYALLHALPTLPARLLGVTCPVERGWPEAEAVAPPATMQRVARPLRFVHTQSYA